MAAYNVTELTNLEYEILSVFYNQPIKLDDTHFIVLHNRSTEGRLTTFSIDGSYNTTEINYVQVDSSYTNGQVVKIDDTHVMVVYLKTSSNVGYAKTFSIDGSYAVTEINSISITDAGSSDMPSNDNSLVQIDSTHYILACRGIDNDGYITTFTLDGSYNISKTSQIEHDTSNGLMNSLVKIDSTHYMLAYQPGSTGDLYIKVFSINGSYVPTETSSTSIQASNSGYVQCSLTQIDATHYAVEYYYTDGGATSERRLKTFSINGSYAVTVIDTENYQTTATGVKGSLVKVDATHLASANSIDVSGTLHGYVTMFSIDASAGSITELNQLDHDTTGSAIVDRGMILIDTSHLLLTYSSSGDDGQFKIFAIEQAVTGSSKFFQLF